MRALVTGCAGFIGRHLVRELTEDNHTVVGVDTLETSERKDVPTGYLDYFYDNTNTFVDDFSEGTIDAIFHLAALPRVQFSILHPRRTNEANIGLTLKLLEFARKHQIKRFVFASSSSVYGGGGGSIPLYEGLPPNPMSPYALQKLTSEHYCRLYHEIHKLDTVSLRYFNVYGPEQNPEGDYAVMIPKFINRVLCGKIPIIYGDGEQTRDFTYINDVVRATIIAASVPDIGGKVFNVGAGHSRSVNDVSRQIFRLAGVVGEADHVSPVIEPRHTLADTYKSKEILGWEPLWEFEDGLKETFNYFKNLK
jgi:nucleoside-diphosphate-sugar epimerase